MRLSDLIREDKRDRMSVNKVWFNIGSIAYTIAFLHDAWLHELTAEKSFAYGAIVIGSGLASKFLSKKYDVDTEILETPPDKRKSNT